MKTSLIAFALSLAIYSPAFSENADDLAREVIRAHGFPPYYAPNQGESEAEKARYRALMESRTHLKDHMLSESTPEKLRISYALSLLEYSISDTFSIHDERRFKARRAVLAERFAELKKQAEQDGAGQPATRSESKPEGNQKHQPEAEGRSR